MKNKLASKNLAKITLKLMLAIVVTLGVNPASAQTVNQNVWQRIVEVTAQEGYVSCFLMLKGTQIEGDPLRQQGLAPADMANVEILNHSPASCLLIQMGVLAGNAVLDDDDRLDICMPEGVDEAQGWPKTVARSYLAYFERRGPEIVNGGLSAIQVMALSMQEHYRCR